MELETLHIRLSPNQPKLTRQQIFTLPSTPARMEPETPHSRLSPNQLSLLEMELETPHPRQIISLPTNHAWNGTRDST